MTAGWKENYTEASAGLGKSARSAKRAKRNDEPSGPTVRSEFHGHSSPVHNVHDAGVVKCGSSGTAHRVVRFGIFEADLEAGELRKGGLKVKLQEQPFQPARLPGQPFKVYWIESESGTLHELPTDVTNQADPNWSADGQSIIFGEPINIWAESGKPKAIYISNLKGIWRLRVRDGRSEFVLSTFSILPNDSCFASGFTPEQSIILPCIRRNSDLYALDLRE